MRPRVCAALLLATVIAAPARMEGSTKCPWPASLDAVAAAPGNHRVVLENEHVRVLDVTVAPGEREALHAHCRPSVMYLMQEGVYRDYDAEGRVIEEVEVAPPAAQFPMTLWLGPQPPHSVHNIDSRPTRLLRVELKGEDPQPPARAEEEIRRLEEIEWARAVRQKDKAWFERHLADDLVVTTGRTGRVTTKEDEIADILRTGASAASDQVTDLRIRAYGNMAIATFRLTAGGTDATGPYERTARYTESWIHRDGRWQLVASHSSLIPAAAK